MWFMSWRATASNNHNQIKLVCVLKSLVKPLKSTWALVKIGSVRHRNNIAWLVSSKTWAGEAQKHAGATAPQSAFNISAAPYQIFGNAPRFPRRLVNEPRICVISSRASKFGHFSFITHRTKFRGRSQEFLIPVEEKPGCIPRPPFLSCAARGGPETWIFFSTWRRLARAPRVCAAASPPWHFVEEGKRLMRGVRECVCLLNKYQSIGSGAAWRI